MSGFSENGMKNKIKCNACDEEIEEYDKAYEYDNKVYCEHCMTPIQGIVGYNKEWEFDDFIGVRFIEQ